MSCRFPFVGTPRLFSFVLPPPLSFRISTSEGRFQCGCPPTPAQRGLVLTRAGLCLAGPLYRFLYFHGFELFWPVRTVASLILFWFSSNSGRSIVFFYVRTQPFCRVVLPPRECAFATVQLIPHTFSLNLSAARRCFFDPTFYPAQNACTRARCVYKAAAYRLLSCTRALVPYIVAQCPITTTPAMPAYLEEFFF